VTVKVFIVIFFVLVCYYQHKLFVRINFIWYYS